MPCEFASGAHPNSLMLRCERSEPRSTHEGVSGTFWRLLRDAASRLLRMRGLYVVLLGLAVPFAGAAAETRQVVDAVGRTVAIADTSRVVSVGGSVTEILYALGLDDRIIAVDTTSVFPPAAMREKPNVGYMRQLSAEGVLSVSPTLILAEDGSGPPDTITLLEKASLPFVLVPNEKSAEGVAEKVRFVGDAMGVAAESDRLADALASDFATLQAEIAPIEKRVRALFVFSLTDGRILAGGS